MREVKKIKTKSQLLKSYQLKKDYLKIGNNLFKEWCLKNKHLSNSKNTHLWEQLFYVHCQKIFGRPPNNPIEVFVPNVLEPSVMGIVRRKIREGEL
tara:strand:+ start:150 stop:437 length:288 start_codon:yes stop_codon:yes gene_type:complete